MKTPPPIVKNLIEFADSPSPNFSGQYDRYAQKLARRWLVVLALGWVSVIVWLIIQLAK